MDANTVIAVCGIVIAVASLGVSAYVALATRKHNRLSVRPLLGLTTAFPAGGAAGLRLTNSGLGPARIIGSQLTVADEDIGEFDRPHVEALRARLAVRPHAATLGGQPFLDTDYQQFLLSVDPYDPSEHREFRQLIEGRLRLKIQYESIYGGEGFTVVYPRRGLLLPDPRCVVSVLPLRVTPDSSPAWPWMNSDTQPDPRGCQRSSQQNSTP